MNERIRELFNQAGGQGVIHPLKYNGTLNVEKFAELIVQECANICDRAANNHVDEVMPLITDKLIIAGAKEQSAKLSRSIKEHFGVE